MPKPDVTVRNDGSIWTFTPRTVQGEEWIDRKVLSESWQWMGDVLCVDWRFGEPLVRGMQGDGLSVEMA